jgi:hypothetical protein
MKSIFKQVAGLSLICAAASPFFSISPVRAEKTCKVSDPTGSPLNIRTYPGGAIVGKIRNGKVVRIVDQMTDDRGKIWVNIGRGWVVREFIACYQR